MGGVDVMVDWLRSVLDEDEWVARVAIRRDGVWPHPCVHAPGSERPASHELCARITSDEITIYDEGGHTAEQAIHIARHDPRSVLARVEAELAIVDAHRTVPAHRLRWP